MNAWAKLAGRRKLRAAGLMSGTSANGVDAAILDAGPRGIKLLAFQTFPYPPALRRAVLDLCRPETGRVDDICHYNFVLGEVFAEALIRLAGGNGIDLASLHVVGSHGQTIHHLPAGRRYGRRRIRSTLQIAEPAVIAERTGIPTVADFRPADVAAGGQGAPLVPITDFLLFAHPARTRAVQNLGGIANVTYLPAGGSEGQVLAFDTGPGNMILDRLAVRLSDGRHRCDRGGRLAAKGRVHAPLLAELMQHPYLRRRPPKSTGREEFGAALADELLARARRERIGPADLLATATAFTARSVADAYRRFLPGAVDEAILCGGGTRNPTLVKMLRKALAPAKVLATDDLGIPADAKEAVSFALLAVRTLRGQPGNVPAATGARRAAVLGTISLPTPKTQP